MALITIICQNILVSFNKIIDAPGKINAKVFVPVKNIESVRVNFTGVLAKNHKYILGLYLSKACISYA